MEIIIISFFADFLIYILFAGLIVLWFIDGKIKKEQVLHASIACLIAWMIALLIKHFFPTVRPYLLKGISPELLIVPTSSSFPSEHTIIAFALSVTVFLHDRKIGRYFLISALLIGVSRVMAHVHYPTDILGGAFLGTIVAVIIEHTHFLRLLNILSKKIKSLPFRK